MGDTQKIELLFYIAKGVIELFRRHQQGENVTKDLDELLQKTDLLLVKETAIANAEVEE